MLSKTESNILNTAVRYVNEIKSIKMMKGFAKGKQVKQKKKKKAIKKMKKDGVMKEANAIHAFEAMAGQLKMRIINYLRLDITSATIRNLVAGLGKNMSKDFMEEIRINLCTDVINHYKHGDLFIRSVEVHKWLYKSGYIKRSAKLAEYLTTYNGYAFAEDILAQKDNYITEATKMLTTGNNIKKYWDEEDDITATQDNFDFMVEVLELRVAMRLALKDIEKNAMIDKAALRNCKYITTQVDSLSKIIADYIKDMQKDIKKHTRDEIKLHEILEYRKQFGKFREIIAKSCKLEGIRFIKENEDFFLKYYEDLKKMTKEKRIEEKEWLGVA